ncbi:hypothetical protein [Nocardioides zeae]|uniref:hypothetical protein n=1 Tax=Nocardioides zeae TaxID=1457234 RepID=UPI0028603387|nr:hypothetical protein [Nocardioides zeae]MDR6176112.1 MYXO-CTERM domain-containing protein [Nocardioides zeae]
MVDDRAALPTAVEVGLAALVLAAVVLHRRRRGERLSVGGSLIAKVVFAVVVVGPAVWFVGVAAGFVLGATSILVLLVVVLAGLVVEAAAGGPVRGRWAPGADGRRAP